MSSRSLTGVERDMELLESAGIRLLRVSIGWDSVEPEQDRYDFEFWDRFVEQARSHRVRLIPYVAYTPRWAADGGTQEDFWKRPPRDDGQFAEIVALLAGRYRETIDSWELWNEPDNPDFWTGDVVRYARLLAAGAPAVRRAHPGAKVVTGGLAGHLDFLAALFGDGQSPARADVVNLHAYFETWNPEPIEAITRYVAGAADIVRRAGGRQPLWMAEVGYSNYRQNGTVSPWVQATFGHEHSLDFQAVALVRTMTKLYASPLISLIAWYELKDPPPTDQVIGDQNNRHLGVTFADRRPKPALAALKLMDRIFSGGFRGLDDETRVERPPSSASEVHAFLTDAGRMAVFGWLRSPGKPPAGGATDGQATDDRHETVRVLLPRRAAHAVRVDAQGRERLPVPVILTPAGTALDLQLAGGDVAIVELAEQ